MLSLTQHLDKTNVIPGLPAVGRLDPESLKKEFQPTDPEFPQGDEKKDETELRVYTQQQKQNGSIYWSYIKFVRTRNQS